MTRGFVPGDEVWIARLDSLCLELPWSASMITHAVSNGTVFVIDELQRGYASLTLAPPEAEINNICVDPKYRRQGIGRTIMLELLAQCRRQGVKEVFLEVAPDNLCALRLYQALGFCQVGVRKNYYITKDALILRLSL